MRRFDDNPQWPKVRDACARLRAAGWRALLAGGCVRDALLGREPHDFDVATDATPDEVERLFPKSVAVGKAFGVIVVPYGDFQIEIATFRADGAYVDGRRPESVEFCGPEEDAKRRDFTVNALFYDVTDGRVIDYVGGERDLRASLLRAVGDPEKRFDEDKLRILRAVRFAAQLGFSIEPRTWDAVCRRANEAPLVSAERIRDELSKLLLASGRSEGARLLRASGLLAAVAPLVARALDASPEAEPRWREALAALGAEASLPALWAVFLFPAVGARAGASGRGAKQILQKLKAPGQLADDVAWILNAQDSLWLPDDLRVADAAEVLADPRSGAAERAQLALARAARDVDRSEAAARKRVAIRMQFLPDGSLPKPFINGDDLKAMGAAPGKKFGDALKEARRLQIEKQLTSREAALEWAAAELGLAPDKPRGH